jgi:hypothetical protein
LGGESLPLATSSSTQTPREGEPVSFSYAILFSSPALPRP